MFVIALSKVGGFTIPSAIVISKVKVRQSLTASEQTKVNREYMMIIRWGFVLPFDCTVSLTQFKRHFYITPMSRNLFSFGDFAVSRVPIDHSRHHTANTNPNFLIFASPST